MYLSNIDFNIIDIFTKDTPVDVLYQVQCRDFEKYAGLLNQSKALF